MCRCVCLVLCVCMFVCMSVCVDRLARMWGLCANDFGYGWVWVGGCVCVSTGVLYV